MSTFLWKLCLLNIDVFSNVTTHVLFRLWVARVAVFDARLSIIAALAGFLGGPREVLRVSLCKHDFCNFLELLRTSALDHLCSS